MFVRCFDDFADLPSLAGAWNQLAAGIPMRRFEWLGTWCRHYGPAEATKRSDRKLCVVALYDSPGRDRLIGLAPWFIQRTVTGGRVLRLLGSGEVCSDYVSLLCRADDQSAVAAELAAWLDRREVEWDAVELADVRRDDRALGELAGHLAARSCRVDQVPAQRCWRLQLPAHWDQYLAMLSKSHRKQVRRAVQRYLDSGRTRLLTVRDAEQFQTAFGQLVDLHQRRRRSCDQPGCFESPRFHAFLKDAARQLLAADRLRLNLLELDGAVVAGDLNLSDGGVLYAFQGGIDPDYLRMQPGGLLTAATIRNAIGEGYCAYDLMRGDEAYKAHWRAEPVDNVTLRIVPRQPAAQLRQQFWRAGQGIRRLARRTSTSNLPATTSHASVDNVIANRPCGAPLTCDQKPRESNGDRSKLRRFPSLQAATASVPAEPPARAGAPLRVELLTSLDQLSAIEEPWNRLAGDHALRRFDWLATWWRHFGRDPRHTGRSSLQLLGVRNERDELVGLAPWYVTRTASGNRVMRFLGSGIVCTDYQSILSHDGYREGVIDALAAWLVERPHRRWNLLELTAVADDDELVPQLTRRMAASGFTVHTRRGENCWRVDLPASWEEYVETLSAKKRAHVRRAVRQMFDTDRAQLHAAATHAQLDQAFDIFRALHQQRRQSVGDPGCFSDPTFAAFLREVAERFSAAGRMDLLWLEWDGQPAAAEFNLHGGGMIYSYQGGIDPELLRKQPGPGHLINIARIRRAIERGDRVLDFLRGDEPYKLDWAARRCELVEYRVVPPRAGDRIRHEVWRAGQTIRTWAKQGVQTVRDRKSPAGSPSSRAPAAQQT